MNKSVLKLLTEPLELEVRMPSRCRVIAHPSTEFPGEWKITCFIEAVDVLTGQPAEFTTRWRGLQPTMADVARVVKNMFAHEIEEQLGLEPHDRQTLTP